MITLILAGVIFSQFASQSGDAAYASISGVVTTGWPSYRPIPNATVVASADVDLHQTITDANGRYQFLTLLPGVYRIFVATKNAIIIFGDRIGGSVSVSSNNSVGAMRYVAPNLAQLRRCMEDENGLLELSAGVAYRANIDLATHC